MELSKGGFPSIPRVLFFTVWLNPLCLKLSLIHSLAGAHTTMLSFLFCRHYDDLGSINVNFTRPNEKTSESTRTRTLNIHFAKATRKILSWDTDSFDSALPSRCQPPSPTSRTASALFLFAFYVFLPFSSAISIDILLIILSPFLFLSLCSSTVKKQVKSIFLGSYSCNNNASNYAITRRTVTGAALRNNATDFIPLTKKRIAYSAAWFYLKRLKHVYFAA